MKHSLKITIILIIIFLTSQIVGLTTVNRFIQPVINQTTGEIKINYSETAIGNIQEVNDNEKWILLLVIFFTILIGTLLIFLLIRFNAGFLFKYWFLIAIAITLAIAFGIYMNLKIAWALAILLALWRIFKPNILIHNFTEIFIYTGIAIAFVNFFNITTAIILLIGISIYDMIAVWKSKHMIKLAKFQTKSNLFAGLLIPYSRKENKIKNIAVKTAKKQAKPTSAILGGGDIAFPLIFASAAMQHFILNKGMDKIAALQSTLIITLFTTIALFILLIKSKKDRFYPAMPFITAGCFIGYLIVLII